MAKTPCHRDPIARVSRAGVSMRPPRENPPDHQRRLRRKARSDADHERVEPKRLKNSPGISASHPRASDCCAVQQPGRQEKAEILGQSRFGNSRIPNVRTPCAREADVKV